MIRRNENGDLVRVIYEAGREETLHRYTAAELRAAGLVLVSVEDARALQIGCGSGPYSREEMEAIAAACDRLRTAIGEQPLPEVKP